MSKGISSTDEQDSGACKKYWSVCKARLWSVESLINFSADFLLHKIYSFLVKEGIISILQSVVERIKLKARGLKSTHNKNCVVQFQNGIGYDCSIS